ncbi:Ldh family oxidoreductase [Dysosmobacter sp.]|uniref:Ldh family oxidoreductase n=1 Tax=Dysosmobacter sp. TaxID=2591382 RepID=UPI002A89F901|nr:Ldh family oxidoreductase [Dysosmobacter sp.]MDY3282782.1 Ldh family oxidoreductase [Dysosmobacter sp.]
MKYSIEQIRDFCEKVWVKAGLSEENAKVCVDVLLAADVRGQRTHGTTHMKDYCDRMLKGTATNGEDMDIRLTSPTSYVVDAKHAVGMVAAPIMMRKCIEQARVSGACFASVHNGCHYGLGAYYPMMAMKEGMIGFSFANAPALVAPYGGADALLGTNPISIALPAERHTDLVLDIATSVAAKGFIALAMKEGRDIPLGWALDKDGNPTTDAAAANEGVLLPFGLHKGYALELIVSLLSFALSGADMDVNIARFFECTDKQVNVGYFMGCIDISKYCPVEDFKKRVDAMFDLLKACRPAAGSKGVLIPGEIEAGKTKIAMEEGIDLSEATLRDFREMADTFGVEYTF